MKSLLITGGTGQLGRVVLARFSHEYNCIALGRNETPKTDKIFGVLHLAGAFTMGSSLEDFTKMLDANLLSAVRAIEPVRKNIEDGGRIIGISSIASRTTPGGLAAYAAAKAALNAYIEVLAKDLQKRRITANALLPSTLGAQGIPYERVADAIGFLLSDAAASISGQLIAMTP
jgi:NAD(P)-dependent dehydrogenase (short-subunit alcohol dehydrogenase family)